MSLPEAMDLLIDYYERFPGENPDWDEYRARMERERRVLLRLTIERAGPDQRGLSDGGSPRSLFNRSPRSSVDRAAAF